MVRIQTNSTNTNTGEDKLGYGPRFGLQIYIKYKGQLRFSSFTCFYIVISIVSTVSCPSKTFVIDILQYDLLCVVKGITYNHDMIDDVMIMMGAKMSFLRRKIRKGYK